MKTIRYGFFSSCRSHREYTKFDDDSLFFGLPVFFDDFLYYSVSSPSTPDQLDQFVNVQSYLFKIKSFRRRDFIRNAEKLFIFYRKKSVSKRFDESVHHRLFKYRLCNIACASPPVPRRLFNTTNSKKKTEALLPIIFLPLL